MGYTKTDLLSDLGTVALPELGKAGLNPFAVELVIESYRQIVANFGRTDPIRFAWCGVAVTLQPFTPDAREQMEANEIQPTSEYIEITKMQNRLREMRSSRIDVQGNADNHTFAIDALTTIKIQIETETEGADNGS